MKEKYFYKINRIDKVPYYLQIKEQLLDVIMNNLEIGDRIDNELELCKVFGVSRPTVRQAIKELEIEGFVIREKGCGTFVKSKKIETSLMQDVAFSTEELENRHIKFLNKILKKDKIIPKREILKALNLEKGEKVNYIERLRLVMKQPLYFTIIYIPDKVCPNFIDNDFINYSSTGLIEHKYGICIASIKRYLNPVSKNLYPKATEILKIAEDGCFFYMRSILFKNNGTPIGFYEDFFSNEKSEFTFFTEREQKSDSRKI